jgi:hypothetical protein
VAAFSGLTLSQAGDYTLALTATGLAPATTGTFTVQGLPATALVLLKPFSNVLSGVPFNLYVFAVDRFGNMDANFNGNVTLALHDNPGGSTLGGTLSGSATGGLAFFPGLTINHPAAGYTIQATAAGLSSGVSAPFNVTNEQFSVTTQPPATVGIGASFGFVASVEDGTGNIDKSFSGSATLSILSSNGAVPTLSGTPTVAAVNGIATFSGLSVNQPGSFELSVSGNGVGSGITNPFTVIAAPTSHVNPLPASSPTTFTVTWSGADYSGGSGIATYSIYVSDNGGAFTLWQAATTQASAAFTGQAGHNYGFYSVATDNVGLVQPTPSQAQATTSIISSITLSGTVFQDITTDGVQDAGEPGIAGQTVFLDLAGTGTLQEGDPTAVTDAAGNYQITISNPGTYTIREVLLGGVVLSAPASGSYSVTVSGGQKISGQNFGNVPTSIAVPLTLRPTTPFPKQGNATADYVEALYRAILDRNADPGGLASWTSQLDSGALTRLQVVQRMRQSPEHFTQEATDFYYTFLGRAPDAAGLASWVQRLENGLTEEQMAFDFLDSPEYLSKGDKYFVDHMYESVLGRAFDAAGEANWLNALGDDALGNPTHPPSLTHAQVVDGFLYSQESLTRLVEGYYQVYLQRLAEPAGLSSWLTALEQGGSFLTIGQQFLSSQEFYNGAVAEG